MKELVIFSSDVSVVLGVLRDALGPSVFILSYNAFTKKLVLGGLPYASSIGRFWRAYESLVYHGCITGMSDVLFINGEDV